MTSAFVQVIGSVATSANGSPVLPLSVATAANSKAGGRRCEHSLPRRRWCARGRARSSEGAEQLARL